MRRWVDWQSSIGSEHCQVVAFSSLTSTNPHNDYKTITFQEINNPETVGKDGSNGITITELVSLTVNNTILEAEPDYKFTISVDDVLLPERPGEYHNFFGKILIFSKPPINKSYS